MHMDMDRCIYTDVKSWEGAVQISLGQEISSHFFPIVFEGITWILSNQDDSGKAGSWKRSS